MSFLGQGRDQEIPHFPDSPQLTSIKQTLPEVLEKGTFYNSKYLTLCINIVVYVSSISLLKLYK